MAFPAIASLLGGLGGGAGAASSGISNASRAMSQFTSTMTNLPAMMAAPIASVKSFGDSIGSLTRLSNPGQFAVFEQKILDAFAAMGSGLEPLMGFVTRLGQFTGDAFAKMAPVVSAASSALANWGDQLLKVFSGAMLTTMEALAPLFDAFMTVAKDLIPIFDVLVPIFSVVTMSVKLFANALSLVLMPINWVIRQLQSLGLVGKSFNPNASSTGMAARNFEVSSSADEFQRQMAAKALSSSGGVQEDPAKAVPGILEKILTILQDFFADIPGAMKDALMAFVDAIVQGIKNAAKAPFQAGYDAAEGLVNQIRGLGIT